MNDTRILPGEILQRYIRACNSLVLSMHLALAFHEHKHHPSIHEHEHMKFQFIHLLFITCDVAYILTYACDHV